jgi:hypothetical protein
MGFSHRNLDLECTCWKKRTIFFQLVSTLFCVVKRHFVEPCSKLPCLGGDQQTFYKFFFRPKCLQEQLKHVRSSTKISMGSAPRRPLALSATMLTSLKFTIGPSISIRRPITVRDSLKVASCPSTVFGMRSETGLPDFIGANIPKREKYVYQMTTNYTKRP